MASTSFQAAVRPRGAAVALDVEVTAGAADARFPDGFNPWRGRIGVRVAAPALAGRANREVCQVVADFFGVRRSGVRIVKGETSSMKTLEVDGVTHEAALARLGAGLS